MPNSTTILVTGGAGYVGSHCCKWLAETGFRPVVYDNLSRGHRWAVQWGEFVEGDLLDTDRVTEALRSTGATAVIHFAALAYVGESVEQPDLYYRNNVAGTLSLLEAMKAANVMNVVFSSTCATYGEPESVPITESNPQNPINPYGRSKLMIEQMMGDFDAAYGLKHVALRYFNAAGGDPDTLIGEAHDPETHLIPLLLDVASGRRPQIGIFGTDYDTPDGTCIRDYIHVMDLADAHVAALNHLFAGNASDALNLGSEVGTSVLEMISATQSATGLQVPVAVEPRRPGDPAVLVADASKAKRVLGWSPRYSIHDQIAHAWAWHQKHHSQ